MAEGGGSGRWLVGCGVVLAGSAVLCCGGGALTLWFLPEILVALATSDHPLSVPVTATNPAARAALEERLAEGLGGSGTVRLTPEDLNLLVADDGPGDVYFSIADDTLAVLASIPVEEGTWINVDASGRILLERGWATSFELDRLVLSDWDLSGYVRGQQGAQQLNRSLADIRAEDPEVARLLDATERLTLEGGQLVVTLDPAAFKALPAVPPTLPVR